MAELNRRGETCEILAGTGIRVAKAADISDVRLFKK